MYQILFSFIAVSYTTFNSNNKKTFNYVGRGEELCLKRGKYEINIYGAQGGYGYGDGKRSGEGGKGMHIIAEFYITKQTSQIYYVFVGEAGVPNDSDPGTITGPNRGGYNGGGSGGADPTDDDASGGGGGATDIRTNKNDVKTRLIVASGGSGGSWDVGAPGGDICGLFFPDWYTPYQCSDNTYTNPTGGKKCTNKNGVGGRGLDQVDGTPSSGGGGGYCGGDSTPHFDYLRPFVSDSGSSYVKKCDSNKLNDELCFFNVRMDINNRQGNGMIEITRKWECSDANCLFCKNAADFCDICVPNYYRYNGGCVKTCPTSTINNGTDCFDCAEGCDTCSGYVYICLSCKAGYYLYHYECLKKCPNTTTIVGKNCVDCENPCYTCSKSPSTCTYCIAGYFLYNNKCLLECPKGTFEDKIYCSLCDNECENCSGSSDFCYECKNGYYLYNNRCYSHCSDLNNITNNEYYGNNNEEQKCQKCIDNNCIDCSENYLFCNKCGPLYYLNQSNHVCIHEPTNIFTFSNAFSLSVTFTHSNEFTNSDVFSKSYLFSSSNSFSQSIYFTKSTQFTKSVQFSKSLEFSRTAYFSLSKEFTKSNIFSLTNHFSFSNLFTESKLFSNSKEFSKSDIFTLSMSFTPPFLHKTTLSKSISLSYILRKSVSFSISYFQSYVYSLTFFDNHIIYIATKTLFSYNFPYIIRYYSLSYVPSYVIIELINKKRLSKEMLIAICCGSASIFFFVLGLIIMILQKKYEIMSNDEFSISDDDDSTSNNKENIDDNLNMNQKSSSNIDDDDDLRFWL